MPLMTDLFSSEIGNIIEEYLTFLTDLGMLCFAADGGQTFTNVGQGGQRKM